MTTVSFGGDGTLWYFEKVMRTFLDYTLAELRRAAPAAATLTVGTIVAIRNELAQGQST